MEKKINVYLAGDSTVQTSQEKESPQAGWGQFIEQFFTEDVQFFNHAIGGRSSKTFVEEGRLEAILSKISRDDYLLIQMGHNDSTPYKPERYTEPFGDYQKYLHMYVEGARKTQAIPILITPVARLHYENNQFVNDFQDYCNAMKQLAIEEHVLCIDLMERSLQYFASCGYELVLTFFMASVNHNDYTHFTKAGAKAIARLVADEIKNLPTPLAKYVKEIDE